MRTRLLVPRRSSLEKTRVERRRSTKSEISGSGYLSSTARRREPCFLIKDRWASGRLRRTDELIAEVLVQELPKSQLFDFGEGKFGPYGGVVLFIRSIWWSRGRRGVEASRCRKGRLEPLVVVDLRDLRPEFCAFGGERVIRGRMAARAKHDSGRVRWAECVPWKRVALSSADWEGSGMSEARSKALS